MTAPTIKPVCEWPGCLRAARSSHSAYCAAHRPWCAVQGCPRRAIPGRTRCRQHRHDGSGRVYGIRQPRRHRALPAVCTADPTCPRRPVARGLCMTHYRRLRRTGTVEPRPAGQWCRYCAEPVERDGLCHEHRRRARAKGNPLALPAGPLFCVNADGRPVYRRGLCNGCYFRRWRAIRRANLDTANTGT